MKIETEKMYELFHMIEKSDVGQQIISDKKAATVAERQAMANEASRLNAELVQLNDEHSKSLTVLDQKIDKQKKVFENLVSQKMQAIAEHRWKKQSIEHQQSKIENILRFDADQELTAAIRFFREIQNRFRLSENVKAGGVYGASDEFLSHDAEGRRRPFFSIKNWEQIDEILRYSKAAIEELEIMRIHPAPDTGRVDALMAELPSDALNLDDFEPPKRTIRDILFPVKNAA